MPRNWLMRRTVRRIRVAAPHGRWLAVALIAGLVALGVVGAPVALAATPAGAGTIDGNLANGTASGAPLAGQTVTLLLCVQMPCASANQRQLATTVTDAQGLFHFTDLATDAQNVYAATVQYQGVPYTTDLFSLADNPHQRVTLLAYETMASDARIGISQVTILLHKPDILTGTIGVSELVTIVNGDQRTYLGTPEAGNGRPMNLLRFALPVGATGLVTRDGFAGGQVLQVDRGFATTAPVLPGETRFAFGYSYPYDGTRSSFTYHALYPTLQVVVLAPPEMALTSTSFKSLGTISAQGEPTQVLQGSNLPAGTVATLDISHLPVPGETSDLDSALLTWLAVILALVAAGFVGYHLARVRRPSDRAPSAAAAAHAGGDGPLIPAGHSTERPVDDAARPKALLLALAQLDREHDAGTVADAAYRAQREALKTQLKGLMLAESGMGTGASR